MERIEDEFFEDINEFDKYVEQEENMQEIIPDDYGYEL